MMEKLLSYRHTFSNLLIKKIYSLMVLLFSLILVACPQPGSDDPARMQIADAKDYGSGTSTLRIDFDPQDSKEEVLFSYQWKGKTTGLDLLVAATKSNSQLYINISGTLGGVFTGAALDIDKDGDPPNWGSNPDKPIHIDPDDLYRYGWLGTAKGNPEFNGYWGYYTAEKKHSPSYAQLGMTSRILTDGSIDLWKFSDFPSSD